jgi:hypothetical protein
MKGNKPSFYSLFRRSHYGHSPVGQPDDEADEETRRRERTESVLLEPPRWADLRLVSDKDGARFVWVVEVKAGSRLDARMTSKE